MKSNNDNGPNQSEETNIANKTRVRKSYWEFFFIISILIGGVVIHSLGIWYEIGLLELVGMAMYLSLLLWPSREN